MSDSLSDCSDVSSGMSNASCDGWEATDEEMRRDLETKHLFKNSMCSDPDVALETVLKEHGVDLLQLKEQLKLDMYQSIKLMNWIRSRMNETKYSDDERSKIIDILKGDSAAKTITELGDEYLIPVIPNDPLLRSQAVQGAEDNWSDDDDQ